MVYQLDCGTYWVYAPVNRDDSSLGPERTYYQYTGKSELKKEGYIYRKHRIEKAFIDHVYVEYPVFGREHIES